MKSKNLVRTTTILSVFVISLLVFSVVLAAAQLIDSFSAGNPDLVANSGTPVVEDYTSDSSILGVERDIVASFVDGDSVIVRAGPAVGNVLFFSLGLVSNGTAQIVYDGEDGIADIDPSGMCTPDCVDLTDGGTNDGIHFEVVFSDQTLPVYIRIYSGDIDDYEEYLLTLPGGIPFGSHVDFKIPFAGFHSVGNGASFNDVGAIEVFIDGSAADGAKLGIDFFEADSFLDYGDAPSSYGTVSHAPNGPRLGMNVDIEASQLFDANAEGDDRDQEPDPPGDEDGVTRPPAVQWTSTSGSITVTVNGCSSPPCYLNSWIVESDVLPANFGSGEQVLNDYVIGDGEETIALTLTSSPSFPNSFFARFRICDELDQCDNPTGNAPTGEVEDYYWSFSPTAVTLSNFQAHSSSTLSLLLAGGMIILALLLAVFILNRGRVRRLNQ